MDIRRNGDRTFLIINAKRLIGEIHLDHCYQTDILVLRTKDPAQIRKIKELATLHVTQYVHERQTSIFGGLMISTHRSKGAPDKYRSYGLMAFDLIPPGMSDLTEKELDAILARHVKVVLADYANYHRAILAAVSHIANKYGIKIEYFFENAYFFSNEKISAKFVSQKKDFRFWMWVSDDQKTLIKNPEHPILLGWKDAVSINGATEAVLNNRNSGIDRLNFPLAEGEREGIWRSIPADTESISNPIFCLNFDKRKFQTKRAAKFLIDLFKAALDLNQTYVQVIA